MLFLSSVTLGNSCECYIGSIGLDDWRKKKSRTTGERPHREGEQNRSADREGWASWGDARDVAQGKAEYSESCSLLRLTAQRIENEQKSEWANEQRKEGMKQGMNELKIERTK